MLSHNVDALYGTDGSSSCVSSSTHCGGGDVMTHDSLTDRQPLEPAPTRTAILFLNII